MNMDITETSVTQFHTGSMIVLQNSYVNNSFVYVLLFLIFMDDTNSQNWL